MGSQRVGHNWATELNWTESMTKQARKYNGEKTVSSVLLWKLDSYLQKNETGPLSYHMQK